MKNKLEIESTFLNWNEIATIGFIINLGVFNLQHTCYFAVAHSRFHRPVTTTTTTIVKDALGITCKLLVLSPASLWFIFGFRL